MKGVQGREAQQIIEHADASLLDIIDHVLNQGIVIKGEVILGLADVDLIYLGLSVILCSADRVQGRDIRARSASDGSGSANPPNVTPPLRSGL